MSPAERERRRSRLYWTLRLWGPAWLDRLLTLGAVGMATWAVFGVQGQADTIQLERAKATFSACSDQNVRHDRTIAKLRALAANAPADGRSRAQREQSVKGSIALIDALAPHQDCQRLVDERVTRP